MDFTVNKVQKIFSTKRTRQAFMLAENQNRIPAAKRTAGGHRKWEVSDLPYIGELYGFLQALEEPVVVMVYSGKGGVFKSTISYNLARTAALHNIPTALVGLDMQGDVTGMAGLFDEDQVLEEESILDAKDKLVTLKGLVSLFNGEAELKDLMVQIDDLPLSVLPETDDLDWMDEQVRILKTNREVWLKRKVIEPLKKNNKLIVIDCGPSWNMLTTNGLFACDVLITPVECKIAHYNNIQRFRERVEDVKKESDLDYKHIFIPVKAALTKKLREEIRAEYQKELPGCTTAFIREAEAGDEASASCQTYAEYSPGSIIADEMTSVIKAIWKTVLEESEGKEGKHSSKKKAKTHKKNIH